MKKNNKSTIIITVVVVAAVGLLIWGGSKNKDSTPAVDQHGMPIGGNNISTTQLNNLVDKPAPDFSFADRDSKVYSSNNLRGKNVVLFFNEGLMCYPACWNQIISLSQDERFKNEDIIVLSVVVDSPQDWQQAINKMPELAQATVVFDNGTSVSKAFNVLSLPSSMHPGIYPGHTYVVIDKEGMVRYVFDDPNMGIRNDQLATELEKLNQN